MFSINPSGPLKRFGSSGKNIPGEGKDQIFFLKRWEHLTFNGEGERQAGQPTRRFGPTQKKYYY
jgi:hypothetical protein